eukprot:scaffold39286_cov21-Prasinocladus_malaysianus.AAC.1
MSGGLCGSVSKPARLQGAIMPSCLRTVIQKDIIYTVQNTLYTVHTLRCTDADADAFAAAN